MPFDSLPEITHTMLQPPYRFGNEKLARLEMLLRTDFETTHRHRWDFERIGGDTGDCGTVGCAIGLASVVGMIDAADRWAITREWLFGEAAPTLAETFGIAEGQAILLFLRPDAYDEAYDDVTPLMVADAIRRYMLTGEV